jgi:hypothetical protein
MLEFATKRLKKGMANKDGSNSTEIESWRTRDIRVWKLSC